MDILQLRVKILNREQALSKAFVLKQLNDLVEARKDPSYLNQDWAFQVHTVQEWLNSTQPPILIKSIDLLTPAGLPMPLKLDLPIFSVYNPFKQTNVAISFGTSKS